MHGQSPVVAAVLLVAVAIGLAVLSGSFVTNIVAITSSSSEAQEIGAGMISVIDARLTTPYTWKVVVQNLTDQNLDLRSLGAAVYRDDHVCGTAKGFVADGNILGPHAVETLYFYGDLDCRLEGGDWELRIFSPTGFATISKVRPPEDVYLWIPFKSVHSMDWSGRHRVFFKTGKTATIYGAHDGNAVGFTDLASAISAGKVGEALNFDPNIKTYVLSRDSSPLKGKRAQTICAWAYPLENSDYGCILDSRSDGVGDGHTGTNLYLTTAQKWAFWYGIGTTYSSVTAPTPISEWNRWYFVCGRIEENNTISLFVDGKLVAQKVDNNFQELNADVPISVGAIYFSGTTNYHFRGYIDDVRVYDRALADEEIAALYRGEDVHNGLVLHYTFDRNTIDTETNTIYDVHMWGRGIVEGGFWLDGNKTHAVFQADVNYRRSSYSYVARVRQLKNDAEVVVVSATTANATIFLDVTAGNPCIRIDYNYASPGSARVCLHDLNVLGRAALLTLTYDIANGIASVCAAIDGTVECNAVEYNALADSPDPNLDIAAEKIGTQWGGAPARMWTKGLIDEVRVYKRALSRDDVWCIYNDPECLIDDENLVVMFTFDFPDNAWEDVPEWNVVPAAPRFQRYDMREIIVNTSAGDSLYLKTTQPVPHSVFVGFRPLSSDTHFPFGFGDPSGTNATLSIIYPGSTVIGGTPAYAGYGTMTEIATVYKNWNAGMRYILGGAYKDGTIYAFFGNDVNTASASYTSATDVFYIGIDPSGSTDTYGSYAFILALGRLIDNYELMALFLLFEMGQTTVEIGF